VPFFFAGTVVSLAIGEAIGRIDRAYLFDLMGAAAGCLLLVPFLDYFGGPNTVIASGVVYAVAASIWFNRAGEHAMRALAVLVALVLVTLMIMNGANHIFDVKWAKGERLPEERMSKWNSFSRVGLTFVQGANGNGGYWDIRIDADAATGVPNIDWSKPLTDAQKRDLLYRGAGLPYVLRPAAKTLVIGSGGGYDLARALGSGSKDVTGVEINPIVANDIMRGQMLSESFGLYRRPEVRIFVEDGRSFVRSSREKYQVLQATLVDTWASTAAGAFALSENNLYTTEAFEEYLSHLTDDGVLAFSRWGFDPPRESLRVVSLGMEALARLGEADAPGHVIVVREKAEDLNGWGALDTILISRKPFAAADIERTRQVAAEKGMDLLYAPGAAVTNAFGEMLTSADPRAFSSRYAYDVSPVFDDRPFFFYTVQPRDLWDYLRNANQSSADYKVNRAVPLLFGLMALCVVATGLVMVLPRVVLGTRLPKQKGILTFLTYFLCLGAGYILIQMALIQKFMLLLGQPTRALTVIVFSMLVASGLGSWASRRVVGDADRRLMKVLAGVAALIAALALLSPPLVRTAATWPMVARMVLTVVMIAPVAFFMGMPFPSGLRRLEQRHAPSLRWAWSLNAAASVLGSVGSVVLAIYLGLSATLLTGGALYLVAMLVILVTPREKHPL
jgi:predicted membrane-bound spermidine synthase